MAAVSLFWDTNIAAVTSCENTLLLRTMNFLKKKTNKLTWHNLASILRMFVILTRTNSCVLWFFLIMIFRVKCEIVDGSRVLKRNKTGLAYGNFAVLKFSYLNITPLVTVLVTGVHECGKLCVDHSACFSANFAAYFHHKLKEGGILCELLPSDKYNNSDQFVFSSEFNHLSIKVGNEILT